ncbi:MAG: response regulator transcription factor [Erysipelotrichaceae bacterium]|nr:response regulator transcription factor [Erysipelotrichaceae bacterium]
MEKRILIIEDDPAIVRLLKVALTTNHYEPLIAENGLSGISSFLSEHPDLVLLDLGFPDIDGMEVLYQIREISKVPVIVVSARSDEKEKVEALDNGADDYVTKPFNIAELMARIRAALRKAAPAESVSSVFECRDLTIDFDAHQAFLKGEPVHFTPIEFRILRLLVRHKGKVLTHKFIQKEVWGYESEDDFQSLRVYMAALRRKIEKDTSRPEYIITEVGVGYRFVD